MNAIPEIAGLHAVRRRWRDGTLFSFLWQNLRDGARLGARLRDIHFDRLIERARSQCAELEPFHAQAAQAALR